MPPIVTGAAASTPGGFTQASATVAGDWTGAARAAEPTTERVPLCASAAFTVALTAGTHFDRGHRHRPATTATKRWNQADTTVTVPGVALACCPSGGIGPGATTGCAGGPTIPCGGVVRAATVTWDAAVLH